MIIILRCCPQRLHFAGGRLGLRPAPILVWFTVWLLSACAPLIPATTPPQLQHTPGAFVSLDDEIFDAGVFQVDYPDGWRVVKISVAAAPLQVVFVSPDESMTLTLSQAPLPATQAGTNTYTRHNSIEDTIFIRGTAPIESRAEFDLIYEHVLESLFILKQLDLKQLD